MRRAASWSTIAMMVRRRAPLADAARRARRAIRSRSRRWNVAHLMLQARMTAAGFRSVRPPARQQEAGQPPGACASTRKASHIGAETNNLWPGARRPSARRPTGMARVVLARTSEPPCFSVIAMPMVGPASLGGNVAGIVERAMDLRQPVARRARARAGGRAWGERHGDRAAMAGLDLRLHVEARGAGDMRAARGSVQGEECMPASIAAFISAMIGGMKAHEIDAPAVAVVGVELGRVSCWRARRARDNRRRRAWHRKRRARARPIRALARDRFLQRGVGLVEVIVGELEGLVEDLVGRGAIGVESPAFATRLDRGGLSWRFSRRGGALPYAKPGGRAGSTAAKDALIEGLFD